MKPTPTLNDALILAAQNHRNQFDKAGKPYILHPLRVMFNLGPDASENERIAAILHDIVEDTPITLENLREMGFCEEVVEAVDHLTKNAEGKADYQKAIERVARNPIAVEVKIADLTDNSDASRIENPTEKDRARIEKYARALEFLRPLS